MRHRAFQMTIVVASTFSSGAGAAEWQLAPTAYLSTAYTDNPRLLADGDDSSAGAVGELSVGLQRFTERTELSLHPRVRSARHREDESLDSDDQLLDAKLKLIGERYEWNSSAGLTRDTTLTSELGSTGLVQSNRRRESITLSGGPTYSFTERLSAGAQAYWLDNHYVDARLTGLVDYEYRALSLFSSYATSVASSFTITAQSAEIVVPDRRTRTRDATLRLGWTYQPHALTTMKLSAGPAYVDARAGDDIGTVFDVDIERRGERWTATANIGRNLTPTGRGVLTRRDRIVLAVSRRMTEHSSTGVSAQWVRNEDLLPQARLDSYQVDYGRIDVNVRWRFTEHWSLALAAGGAMQRHEAQRGDAENYRASLSFVWNGQPHSL